MCPVLSKVECVAKINAAIEQSAVKTSGCDAKTRWELMKKEVKKEFVAFSRQQSSDEKIAISQLSEYVTVQEDNILELSENELQILQTSKDELQELMDIRTKGVIFRSRAKWALEGEKNTKYFLNLEKNRYSAKTCCRLLDSDGESIICDPKEILDRQRQFYQELYTADPDVEFNIPDIVENKIDPSSAAAADVQISMEELQDAIKGMKNNSCPGADGLPVEFYKMFWGKIKVIYYDALLQSFQEGIFYPTARLGVLNLIPKGNKDTRLLKNLRPITLLNVDYKIVEKAMANRMTPELCAVIHEDQKGFLPGRRISANIRKIIDTVTTASDEDLNGLILSCDFMKCFDRVEFDSFKTAMKYFGFSDTLIEWANIMYNQFGVKVQNNGHFSDIISVTRSVHQGGPASNCLLLCVAELLAIIIRSDVKVKGIFVKEILNLLNQYADDMDIALESDQQSFTRVLDLIGEFRQNTGFMLSYDKTSVYRLGAMRRSNATLYSASELSWTDTINVLGIDIVNDEQEMLKINYTKIIDRATGILTAWQYRGLSLLGKVNIINTLVSSLFVYKMMVLPKIPQWVVKQMDQLFESFIWNGHRPKIALSILKTSKQQGGAGLCDLVKKDISLKCSWIQLLLTQTYPQHIVYQVLSPSLRENIWCVNLSDSDVDQVVSSPHTFWRDVFSSWCKYHYCEGLSSNQILWWNSNIKIAGKPICWSHAIKQGLMYVGQICRNGAFLEETVVHHKFGLTTMEYNSLKSAIPRAVVTEIQPQNNLPFTDPKFAKYMANSRPASFIYRNVELGDDRKIQKKEAQWKGEGVDCDIPKCCRKINRLSSVMKARSFQYRFLMRAIVTNVHLK